MENNEQNVVTEDQMIEAMNYVRSYVRENGGNEYDIDWDTKPKFLPDDVSRAWDTYKEFWNTMRARGIIP